MGDDILGISGMMRAILGEAVWRQVEADCENAMRNQHTEPPRGRVVSSYEVDGQQYEILDRE